MALAAVWVALLGAHVAGPEPPLWPEVFHCMFAQTTPTGKGVVHLYYDWPAGRNLNIIDTQVLEKTKKGTLWDYERQDGLSFYFTPRTRECKTVEVGYGLIPPSWLRDEPAAKLVGDGVMVGPFKCNVWTKGESDTPGVPFITYYAEAGTDRPVKWVFFTGQELDVITYSPGESLPEESWQVPQYCSPEPSPAGPGGTASVSAAAVMDARSSGDGVMAALAAWHAQLVMTSDGKYPAQQPRAHAATTPALS